MSDYEKCEGPALKDKDTEVDKEMIALKDVLAAVSDLNPDQTANVLNFVFNRVERARPIFQQQKYAATQLGLIGGGIR